MSAESVSTMMRWRKGRKYFLLACAFSALVLLLYTLLYQYAPFSNFADQLLSNLFTVFASLLCALFAFLARSRYERSDPPRQIWTHLSIALILWGGAEIIWAVYNVLFGEVGITVADLLWTLAYGFMFAALFAQYQILFRPEERLARWVSAFILGGFIALVFISAKLLNLYARLEWNLELWLNVFYPLADLAVALAALRVVHRFRSGALGYPWFGLFVFTVSDLLYAWLNLTNTYSWSVNRGNALSAAADISYFGAYLVVGLGCYAQWLLLKYGPIFHFQRKS